MDYLPHLLTNLPAFRLTSDFYKILIFSWNRRKLSVGALLDDLSVIHDENLVGLLDGGQAVGNRDDRLAARKLRNGLLDEVLVFGVDARGRLIEDDNGRVLEDGPRDGRALIALFEKLGLCGGVNPV